MRFSVVAEFFYGFAVSDEFFFGFTVSNILQCPPPIKFHLKFEDRRVREYVTEILANHFE